MATTYNSNVQQLYVAYFNRPADPAGLAYWEGVVEANNGNTTAISAAFAASAEYKVIYAGMSNSDIVNAVYQNLFGRPAEDAGKAYWANLLTNNKITIDAVVTQIAMGAQGTDMTAYNNKVIAAGAFTAAVDTDAEKAGYVGDAANKIAKAYLSGITDANSLAANTTPAAINTAVANTVAAGTTFSVAGALANINAANKALTTYVQSVDVDGDATTTTTAGDITAAKATAASTVANDLTGGATGPTGSLFISTSSQQVRDALVAAQQATNAAQLAQDQKAVSDDNAAIAQVSGLSNAMSALTAAKSTLTAATAAQTAADADLAAKQAAFQVANNGTLTVNSTQITLTTSTGAVIPLADVTAGTNGNANTAKLHDGVDATKYAGLTDMIASFNADATAHNTVNTAKSTVAYSQLGVNLLDLSADNGSTVTVNGTQYANERALVTAIAAQINATTANTVATGATPTVGQIQTELAVLKAADTTTSNTYENFLALVTAAQTGSNDNVTSATSTLNTANTTLNTDIGLASTAHSNYTSQVSTFNTTNSGTVAVSGNALVFTPTGGGTATTVATLDPTTKQATASTSATQTGISDLVSKYNADLNAATTVANDKIAVSNAQNALNTATAAFNPLTSKLAADTALVTADNKVISTLAKDVAALSTANANATTLAGYQASVDAYTQALKDKGYNPVTLNTVGGTEFGTAKSDIYIFNGKSETIGAFGLQGNDSLAVDPSYTLVKGAIGATGVTGSNTAMEIFVSSNSSGDAVLQIETHAYSSSVLSTAGEVVTITLTGVDASTLQLNNGIITSGAAHA